MKSVDSQPLPSEGEQETDEHVKTRNVMTPTLDTIEQAIEQLPVPEQLALLERLASRIRSRALRTSTVDESDLIAMANDPAIRRELQQIEAEFSVAESDGVDSD